MTSVSVVITCFNLEKYIGEAIASALQQTRPADEVIVVDDQSQDDSPRHIQSFPVRYLRTPVNGGPSAARNLGLREAKGTIVALLDGDDSFDPVHLATLVPLLERWPEAAVAFSRFRMFGDRNDVAPIRLPADRPTDAFWNGLRSAIAPPSATLVRRGAALEIGGYDERMRTAEDFDFLIRLARRWPFVCSHQVTCNYRVHAAQSSQAVHRMQLSGWAARERLLATLSEPKDAAVAQEVGRRYLEMWVEDLAQVWRYGDPGVLRDYLALHRFIPGSAGVHARWKRRALLLPLVRLWDRLPPGLRSALRGRLVRQPGDPPR
jgi:glycosyltransferase involved in cell wall biosynthesis